jgi:hypothetical protein
MRMCHPEAQRRHHPHGPAEVREKNAIHLEAARAAGCEFVPLVFTSLGRMHEITEKWLKLDDMALDERLLQRIGSGRREFTARLIDGVSCALARGNARILYFVCAEIARARMRAQAPPDQEVVGIGRALPPDRGLSRAGP